MSNAVGEDDEVLGCVERLIRAEKDIGKDWRKELVSVTSGAVHDEDRVIDLAGRWVLPGLTDGGAMEFETFVLGSIGERELGEDEIVLDRGRVCES